MPSPSAFSKFGLSILKFFKDDKYFMYSKNYFGIFKSQISINKLDNLSKQKMF